MAPGQLPGKNKGCAHVTVWSMWQQFHTTALVSAGSDAEADPALQTKSGTGKTSDEYIKLVC